MKLRAITATLALSTVKSYNGTYSCFGVLFPSRDIASLDHYGAASKEIRSYNIVNSVQYLHINKGHETVLFQQSIKARLTSHSHFEHLHSLHSGTRNTRYHAQLYNLISCNGHSFSVLQRMSNFCETKNWYAVDYMV